MSNKTYITLNKDNQADMDYGGHTKWIEHDMLSFESDIFSFFLKKDIYGFSLCACVSVHMSVDDSGCQRHWIPWSRIIRGCVWLSISMWNQTQAPCKSNICSIPLSCVSMPRVDFLFPNLFMRTVWNAPFPYQPLYEISQTQTGIMLSPLADQYHKNEIS